MLLDALSAEDRGQVLAATRLRRFARDDVVFRFGDPAASLHIIRRGHFMVAVHVGSGEAAIVTVLGLPDFFGELSLLDGGPRRRTSTVTALGPAETLELSADEFHRLCRLQPQVRTVVERAIAANAERLTGLLGDALFVGAEERVRKRLRELAGLYRGDAGPVTVPLAQRTLAEIAGTSRATVNRVLQEEQAAGRVRLGRGRVVVL